MTQGVIVVLRSRRSRLVAGAVGALTAATLALGASPASASNSYNGLAYIYGSGQYYDDWWDEGILSTSTNTASNATCLWQKILWADGFLSSASDIDGVFGSKTYSATRAWQTKRRIGVDGSVGKDTFTTANGQLIDSDFNGSVDAYLGDQHTFGVSRNSEDQYVFTDGDGHARIAGYNYRTCS